MKFTSYDNFLKYLEEVEKTGVVKFTDSPRNITLEKVGNGWKLNGILLTPSLEETFILLRKFWLTEYSFYEEYLAYQDWKEEQDNRLFRNEQCLFKASKVLGNRKWSHAHISRKMQWLNAQLLTGKMTLNDVMTHVETCK